MKKIYSIEVILVFIMTVIAYGYFYSGVDWNTNSRLSMVKAVVEENRFEIDSYFSDSLKTKDVAKLRQRHYSDKAIGSALIGNVFYFPIYAIGQVFKNPITIPVFKELMTFLVAGLISAFLAPFIYSFAKTISHNARTSLLVTAAICIGTPFYKYSTAYYGHTLAGLFLFGAFFLWFNIKNEEKVNPTKVLISGYFLAFGVITEYPTAIIAGCIGLYILYILWKKHLLFDPKIYIRLMIGAAIPIILVFSYNMTAFRHPFKTGYGYEMLKTFAEGQSGGLMGISMPNLNTLYYMTFHTTMGIFWQSPVLLLALVGWFKILKDSRYRAEATLSFCVISVYFLMMSGYYMWWGGAAFTPRSLIPVLPFFAIPLAFLLSKREKFLLVLFAVPSILQMFIVSASSNYGIMEITDNMLNTSFSNTFRQSSTLYNVYIPNFFNQFLSTNRGQEFFNLAGFSSLIPLLLIEAALLITFIKITAKKEVTAPQTEQLNAQ